MLYHNIYENNDLIGVFQSLNAFNIFTVSNYHMKNIAVRFNNFVSAHISSLSLHQ